MGLARYIALILLGLALALEGRALYDDETSLREQTADADIDEVGQIVVFLHDFVGHDGAQGLELVVGIAGLTMIGGGAFGILARALKPPAPIASFPPPPLSSPPSPRPSPSLRRRVISN